MAAPLNTRYPIVRSGSTLYVKVYTSHPYDVVNPAINRLAIVVHGSSMNPIDYRDRLVSRLGPNVLVVAPLFAEDTENPAADELWWSSGWREGNRSQSATTGGATLPFRVSSFEVADQLRADLTARFANVTNVVVGGFSAGGQFVQRYSMTQTGDPKLAFVVGAPSSYAYVNPKRPTSVPSSPPAGYDDWKYGLANIGAASVSYVDTLGAQTMRNRLQAAKVTYIVGSLDTGDIGGLDTTAQANVQGASGRLERRANYLTHLADHYGSSILTTHTSVTVPGAGHDGHYEVFNSVESDAVWLRDANASTGGSVGNDLSRFELQLPTGTSGNVDVVERDALVAGYTSQFFTRTSDGLGNRLTCPVNGVTTSGTTFPRTELREVNPDGSNAAWHPSDGQTRTLQTTIRVNHLPDADPEVTLMQLHNEDTEVVALRTAKIGAGTIRVAWRLNGSTQTTSTITQDYQWGTDFTVKVVVDPTNVTVFGNGVQMYQWPFSTLTPGPNNKFYFKAGNYLQANTSTAPAAEYGEVEHRSLSLTYSGAGGSVTYNSAWVGAGTTTSVPVAVNTTSGPVRLKVGTDAAVTQGTFFTPSVSRGSDGDTLHTVTGLTAGTTYYARVEENGTLVGDTLKFHTAYDQPRTIKLVFGSCTKNTDGSPVMTTMLNSDPDYFWHLGDLYYNDGISKTKANFRNEFNKKLQNSQHRALLTKVPSLYTPSDHEGLANNTVGTMVPEWATYLEVYREKVPVLPAVYALPSGGIYSAVQVTPRILFVNLDGRTYKSNPAATDNSSKHVWGAAQETWLQNTLNATTAVYAVIAVPDVGWNGLKVAGEENLSGYRTTVERVGAMLANWKLQTGKVADLIAGDAHFLAANDGSAGSPGGMPLFHAAPFSNLTEGLEELPGAQWTRPPVDSRVQAEQYGELLITDTGGSTITRRFRGLMSDGSVKLSALTLTSTVPTGTSPGGGGGEEPPPPPPVGGGGGNLLFDNGLSGTANAAVTLAALNANGGDKFSAESTANAAVATFTSNGAGIIVQANSAVKWWEIAKTVGEGGTLVTYLRLTRGSYPLSNMYLIRYGLGGSTVARLMFNTSGILQLMGPSSTAAVGTVPIPQDREVTIAYGVKASADAGVGWMEFRWWAAPQSDPTANPDVYAAPGDSASVAYAVGPGIDSIRFGNTAANNTGTTTLLDVEVYDNFQSAAVAAVNAGVDKSAQGGSTVTLSASGTPSGGTYAWARAASPGTAPGVTLSGANTQTATFTAPNAPGTTANFTVTYTPPAMSAVTDTVAVSFTAGSKPVVLFTRRDLTVLDASASPGDVRISQTAGSPVDVAESPADVFTLDTTDVGESLQFQLVTNDGTQDSDPQIVDVSTNGTSSRVSSERYWDASIQQWQPTRTAAFDAAFFS